MRALFTVLAACLTFLAVPALLHADPPYCDCDFCGANPSSLCDLGDGTEVGCAWFLRVTICLGPLLPSATAVDTEAPVAVGEALCAGNPLPQPADSSVDPSTAAEQAPDAALGPPSSR